MKAASELFVDASGWLAYLDSTHPQHSEAVRVIDGAWGNICTSDQDLLRLSYIAISRQIDKIKLSKLVLELWAGKKGRVIRVSEGDTMLAWESFCQEHNVVPTFFEYLNVILVLKNNIKRIFSSNGWLRQQTFS